MVIVDLSICNSSLQRGPATLLALDGVEESLAQRDNQAGFFVTFLGHGIIHEGSMLTKDVSLILPDVYLSGSC